MGENVPAGGPASIHGFLYQLLSNLSHLARARMSGDGDSLLLTLEPGAGDAVMARAGHVLVEQYKTRSAEGRRPPRGDAMDGGDGNAVATPERLSDDAAVRNATRPTCDW